MIREIRASASLRGDRTRDANSNFRGLVITREGARASLALLNDYARAVLITAGDPVPTVVADSRFDLAMP